MRKVIFLIHLSLDGLTAGLNDELDWIAYDHELEQDAHALHDRTDAVIWGRRTYEGMAGYWLTVPDNPASTQAELEHAHFLDKATKIVVSRTLERIAWNNAQSTVLIKDPSPKKSTPSNSSQGKISGCSAVPRWRRRSCNWI